MCVLTPSMPLFVCLENSKTGYRSTPNSGILAQAQGEHLQMQQHRCRNFSSRGFQLKRFQALVIAKSEGLWQDTSAWASLEDKGSRPGNHIGRIALQMQEKPEAQPNRTRPLQTGTCSSMSAETRMTHDVLTQDTQLLTSPRLYCMPASPRASATAP